MERFLSTLWVIAVFPFSHDPNDCFPDFDLHELHDRHGENSVSKINPKSSIQNPKFLQPVIRPINEKGTPTARRPLFLGGKVLLGSPAAAENHDGCQAACEECHCGGFGDGLE